MAADGDGAAPARRGRGARGRRRGCATAGVESVAVCLLHSYLYPEHEERLGAILREELPGVAVSLSSEILREQREYERSATTVVNAYVRPLMERYVADIRSGLDGAGIDGAADDHAVVRRRDDRRRREAAARCSRSSRGRPRASSPRSAMARRLGFANAITFDMGGTTAKASLIENGAVSRGREYEVGGSLSAGSRLMRGAGELLRIPTIDIAEVGAGGGSIAWLDPAGGLQVGPRCAGAAPGPACYGRGGEEPTVTDANVCARLHPGRARSPTARSRSRASSAEQALERVAGPLGLSTLPRPPRASTRSRTRG